MRTPVSYPREMKDFARVRGLQLATIDVRYKDGDPFMCWQGPCDEEKVEKLVQMIHEVFGNKEE